MEWDCEEQVWYINTQEFLSIQVVNLGLWFWDKDRTSRYHKQWPSFRRKIKIIEFKW